MLQRIFFRKKGYKKGLCHVVAKQHDTKNIVYLCVMLVVCDFSRVVKLPYSF